MKCLIVLSHCMSTCCELGVESVARSLLAAERFSSGDYEFLITIGWAYRKDCDTPISDVVKDFIVANSDIDDQSVVSLAASRDTVGDAYYSLEYLQHVSLDEIHIVTSDYHVRRTEMIFKKIFNDRVVIRVFGAKTDAISDDSTLLRERDSIEAFKRTFALTDCSSIEAIYNTLSTRHPFYNGKVYPRI